ncbi:unnamed protein product, partial [Ceratitis capitata]
LEIRYSHSFAASTNKYWPKWQHANLIYDKTLLPGKRREWHRPPLSAAAKRRRSDSAL